MPEPIRILRVIARLNMGGPAHHVGLLSGLLDPERYETLLLHGNGHNTSDKARFCQYISMNPAADLSEASREQRIACWRNNTHPAAKAFPGDPRRIEEQRAAPAELTDLGRKLLGLDPWD